MTDAGPGDEDLIAAVAQGDHPALLALYAGRVLERHAVSGPGAGALRYAPAAAALAVTASGVMIAARTLLELHRL